MDRLCRLCRLCRFWEQGLYARALAQIRVRIMRPSRVCVMRITTPTFRSGKVGKVCQVSATVRLYAAKFSGPFGKVGKVESVGHGFDERSERSDRGSAWLRSINDKSRFRNNPRGLPDTHL
jgi:hypothetical protein